MVTTALVLRHSGANDLGTLEACLHNNDISYRYVDAYHDDIADLDGVEPELLIVLGGSPGVYQHDHYDFIKHELVLLEKRLAADLPTLGICLGAQLMAKALGAEVYKGAAGPEIGWYEIEITPDAAQTAVRHFDKAHTKVVQWHGDTFDVPHGARLLASSTQYQNQIFSFGQNALALQCHVEMSHEGINGALTGSASAVDKKTIDIHKIRQETKAHLATMTAQTERFFNDWL